MKIIISHDVDHLYNTDHLFSDLYWEKYIIRNFLFMLKRKISLNLFAKRFQSLFVRRMNRIEEIVNTDTIHGVKSTFFFGMKKGLGMSYRASSAKPWIQYVMSNGFAAGVHGIAYNDIQQMKKEHDMFEYCSETKEFGIRNHYVRYNETTFIKQDSLGYLYDSTEFNKNVSELKPCYKFNKMWEFPLCLMDSYLNFNNGIENAKEETCNLLERGDESGIKYFTILFHDVYYNENIYPLEKQWYDWLIKYCKENGYEFISFNEAVRELEGKS